MRSIFLYLLFVSMSVAAQEKSYENIYATTTGKVHFYSRTPLEDIDALTTKAICAFNANTGTVQAKMQMSSFQFKQKLMQEHFNENYVESNRYPYGSFNGSVVEKVDYSTDGVYEVTAKGILEIHGVKKTRDIKVKLAVKDGKPTNVTSEFDVPLVDHKIKIPKAVMFNIAEIIKVDLNFDLELYEKK